MTGLIKNEIIKLVYNRKTAGFMLVLLAIYMTPVVMTVLVRIRALDGQSFPLTMYGITTAWALPLFLIVIVAEMITEEGKTGTLALSLVHPVSRLQLLLAKVMTLLLLIIAMLGYALLLGYAIGTFFFGWGTDFLLRGTVLPSIVGIALTVSSFLGAALPLLSFCILVIFLGFLLNGSASVVGAAVAFLLTFAVVELIIDVPYVISSYFNVLPELLYPLNINALGSSLVFVTMHGLIFFIGSFLVFLRRDITE